MLREKRRGIGMKKEKEDREIERKIHFTIRVTPIVPAFGNDDVVHISESEDDAREGTPCPP